MTSTTTATLEEMEAVNHSKEEGLTGIEERKCHQFPNDMGIAGGDPCGGQTKKCYCYEPLTARPTAVPSLSGTTMQVMFGSAPVAEKTYGITLDITSGSRTVSAAIMQFSIQTYECEFSTVSSYTTLRLDASFEDAYRQEGNYLSLDTGGLGLSDF